MFRRFIFLLDPNPTPGGNGGVSGGPGDLPAAAPVSEPAAAPATPPPATAVPDPDPAAPAPANDPAVEAAAAARAASRPAQPPAEPQGDRIGELIFEDADKAVDKIEERVLRAVDAREERKLQQAAFWERFYVENPDLKGAERVVQSTFSSQFDRFKTMSPENCRKELAKETRGVVDSVLQSRGVTPTEMPSGGSTSLGASGQPAPRATAQAEVPKSFVEEARSLQKWR